MTFNDGQILMPAFGEGEPMLSGTEVLSWTSDFVDRPLDALHANATAFYGLISFDFGFEEWPERLDMGQEGKSTTVTEYLQGIDAWCKRWKLQEDTNVSQSMQETFRGWRHFRTDFEKSSTIYVLK